jgi:hypothetical protein
VRTSAQGQRDLGTFGPNRRIPTRANPAVKTEEAAMHDQWEYKLLIGLWSLKDENGVDYGKLSHVMLNKLGKEGWEVCSHNFSFVSPVILILKRRITPP